MCAVTLRDGHVQEQLKQSYGTFTTAAQRRETVLPPRSPHP